MRTATSLLPSADFRHNAPRSSNTPIARTLNLTAPRQRHFFISYGRGGIRRSAMEVCQICVSGLPIWAFSRIWQNEKTASLRAFSGQGGTDSLPGHYVFKYLQTRPISISFQFIPKSWPAGCASGRNRSEVLVCSVFPHLFPAARLSHSRAAGFVLQEGYHAKGGTLPSGLHREQDAVRRLSQLRSESRRAGRTLIGPRRAARLGTSQGLLRSRQRREGTQN
jgi:hypothetical protein